MPRKVAARVFAALALAALAVQPAPAQRVPGPAAAPGSEIPSPTRSLDALPGPGRAFLSSALLPGTGQWSLGQRRWILYGALEAGAWILHFDEKGDGRRFRTAYRDLAWTAARQGSGPRIDGDFDYYEAMAYHQSSGLFDREPAMEGVQPETDAGTFNGALWSLALELHPGAAGGPGTEAYARAVQYYAERAIPAELAWDWSGSARDQERFRSLIRRSDDAFQRATTAVGAVVANHLLSGVDAFLSARLRRQDLPRVRLAPAGPAAPPGSWEIRLGMTL